MRNNVKCQSDITTTLLETLAVKRSIAKTANQKSKSAAKITKQFPWERLGNREHHDNDDDNDDNDGSDDDDDDDTVCAYRISYRESAFAFAISAAGVAHSVARACSQGRLMSCGCDPSVNRKTLNKNLRQSLDKEKKLFLQYLETNQILTPEEEKKYERSKIASRWKWGGCSHNMDFGVEFSKLFLDCREKAGDIQSKINLHNNHAGRMSVSNNMEFRCKCHGMSGSCQLKTCWKSAPDFHVVGKVLKHQFRRALLVDQSNLGNGEPIVVLKRSRNKKSNNGATNTERSNERHERPTNRKSNTDKYAQRQARKLETSLFYYQRSPNFCEKDPTADILGM
uniref:Protein Wnt n=1 Tax=Glossina morsitans morsitans TaxID=37546 RepID=A0A1B0FD09_GLOMM